MLKLMLDFLCYFLTSRNHLISSDFKFVFFSFGAAPLEPAPSCPSTWIQLFTPSLMTIKTRTNNGKFQAGYAICLWHIT